jgi:predicted Zn-dependent peptidase
MRLVFRTAAEGSKEAMMADLLSSVLSNGKAGLLDLNLNKQQKVLGASAGVRQYKDYGVFIVAASPKQGQTLEQVKDLLMEQLTIVKEGKFDENLIKAIVANEKLQQLQGLENNANRVENITDGFIKNKGLGWKDEIAQLDELAKISKKDLVEFANRFLGDRNYAILYKRKGEDKSIVKVDKPTITPVETNAGKQSPFVKQINELPLQPVKPLFLDFTKDMQQGKAGKADLLYVQNKENSLFRLYYRFNVGGWNDKLLPLAIQYLQFLNTDKYTAEQISKEFYNLACSYSINPGAEETTIFINGLQENFDKAVSLLDYVIRNCKPDNAALEGLKNRLTRTRANNKLNKNAIMSALRTYGAYGEKNPFNYTLSDAELKNLKAEDLVAVLHKLLDHEHKIIYYGPQSLASCASELAKIHALPSVWSTSAPAASFVRSTQTTNQVLFTDYDMVQAEIYWVRTLDKYDPKKEAVVNLFNNYFGRAAWVPLYFKPFANQKHWPIPHLLFCKHQPKKKIPFLLPLMLEARLIN